MIKSTSFLLATLISSLLANASFSQQPRVVRQSPGQSLGPPFKSIKVTEDRFEIPITLASTQILVDDVMVNGEGPFRFMLDTGGMGGGRVDSSLADKLGLKQEGEVTGSDGTGRPGQQMAMYELDSLVVGGITVDGLRVISRDYNLHGAAVRGHIDGIIGFGLFKDLLLTIDYSNRKLIVEKGELPEPDGKTILSAKSRGVAGTEIELLGQTFSAHLDTGAMGWISVSEEIAGKLEFQSEPVQIGEARTVSGAFPIKKARLNGDARLGEHEIENPVVVIGAPLRGVNFGGYVLRDFVITYDQKNERIRVLKAEGTRPNGIAGFTRAGRQPVTVPMDTSTGHPIVHAKINGKGPFPFILDTGADSVVLDKDLIEELALNASGETRIGDPTSPDAVKANTYSIENLSIGEARFEEVSAIGWKGFGRSNICGFIGISLLYDTLVEMDFANEELTISRGALGSDSTEYYYDQGTYFSVDLKLGDKSLKTHIDTGNAGQIALPLSYAENLDLQSDPRRLGRAKTISGEFDVYQATMKGNLDFAGQTFVSPLVHFNDYFDWGNIGSGMFKGHVLTIDQVNRRIKIQPAKSESK